MISVIVPVYNAEKYISRCVNSILNQTYKDWELFLIDDGSKDDSFKIIQKYAESDKRISCFHQENQGAGAARNKGLEFVSGNGNYIVFVDSDDYIETSYFERLSIHTEDVVFIDVNRRNENGKIVAEEKLSILSSQNMNDIIRGQMTGKILWGGVRKAVKYDLIKKNNIYYSTHRVGEEAVYSFLLLFYAETIGFIDGAVYNYEVHPDSLSQSIQEDPWGPVVATLRNQVKELGCYSRYAETLNSFIVTAGIVSLSKLAKKYRYGEYVKAAKKRINSMDQLIDYNYSIDKKHMNIKAKILLPCIKLKCYWIIFMASRLR